MRDLMFEIRVSEYGIRNLQAHNDKLAREPEHRCLEYSCSHRERSLNMPRIIAQNNETLARYRKHRELLLDYVAGFE